MSQIKIKANYVSAVLIRNQNSSSEILLLKRAKEFMHGIWCHVAGRVENGEKAWEAALREIKEETGLIPESFYSADFCEQFYEYDKNEISIVPAFVAFVNHTDKVILNNEHSEFKWISINKAKEMVAFGGQRNLYEFINEEFLKRKPCPQLEIKIS